MRDGNLVAIGSVPELKRRFGADYTCSLATLPEAKAERAVHEYMRATFPASRRLQEPVAGRSKYEVSAQDVAAAGGLSAVLKGFAAGENELHLSDWSISETTLEEVRAHLEDAARATARRRAPLSRLFCRLHVLRLLAPTLARRCSSSCLAPRCEGEHRPAVRAPAYCGSH